MILLLLVQAVEQLARPAPSAQVAQTEQIAPTSSDVTVAQLPDTPKRVVQPDPLPTDSRDRRSNVGEDRLLVTILGQSNGTGPDATIRDLGVEAVVGSSALPALRRAVGGDTTGKKP